MAVDERGRLQLADAAKRAFGDDAGITLMELLPPVGWADVATKHDLVHLETVMDARFDAVDHRFEAIDRRFEVVDRRFGGVEVRLDRLESKFDDMAHELRALTWKLVTVVIAVVGTVAAAVRL